MAQLIDPRKPRDLTDAVDLVNPPKPFLITNVFKDERQHTVNTFDYAIEAGSFKRALYANPHNPPALVERLWKKVMTEDIPLIKEKEVFTAIEQFEMAPPGTIYIDSADVLRQNAQMEILRNLGMLQERTVRLLENFASQLLCTGSFTRTQTGQNAGSWVFNVGNFDHRTGALVSGYNVEGTAGTFMTAGGTYAQFCRPAIMWDTVYASNTTTNPFSNGAQIFDDVRKAKQAMAERAGVAPTIAIVGSNVFTAMSNNMYTLMQQWATRFNTGGTMDLSADALSGAQLFAQGVMGMDWYCYTNPYTDDAGTFKHGWNPDYIGFVAPSKSFRKHYGVYPHVDTNGILISEPHRWVLPKVDDDMETFEFRMYTSEMVAIHNPLEVIIMQATTGNAAWTGAPVLPA